MKRSHRILLIVGKLALVGLFVAWLYLRSDAEMRGDRDDVLVARGALTAAAPGGPGSVQLGQVRAVELYDLVKEGPRVAKGDEMRGTVEIVYSTGEIDRLQITGRDRVTVNGSTRKVNPQILQALLVSTSPPAGVPPATVPTKPSPQVAR